MIPNDNHFDCTLFHAGLEEHCFIKNCKGYTYVW